MLLITSVLNDEKFYEDVQKRLVMFCAHTHAGTLLRGKSAIDKKYDVAVSTACDRGASPGEEPDTVDAGATPTTRDDVPVAAQDLTSAIP